ncbi:hypothetical protein CY35_08G038200 [Sphagnum magellanicum]|nr:hypothetical protein CY35_08G038200 [Sphagnum magellanicum]
MSSVANGMTPSSRRGATPTVGGATTIDLFSWSEARPAAVPVVSISDSNNNNASCLSAAADPSIRMLQQTGGGISSIIFGEHISPEEADALLKRRPGSDSKKREMHGSGGIFFPAAGCHGHGGDGEPGNGTTPALDNRTSVRYSHHQAAAAGVSQISFGGENCASPKKAVYTVPEGAKQKELSGTVQTTDDLAGRRVNSNAKAKELVGSNIFGPLPSPEIPKPSRASLEFKREGGGAPPPEAAAAAAAPRNVHTSVKVSNPAGGKCQISFGSKDEADSSVVARKSHDHKNAELWGHDIFSEKENADAASVLASSSSSSHKNLHHHHPSQAKLKELSGSDIFSDDKPVARDFIGGIRKPPGGGSTISLH